jgi:Tfp pilus assembly protein PilZ
MLRDSRVRDEKVPRVFYHQAVAVKRKAEGEVFTAWGLNLSSGGMFLRTDAVPQKGEAVELSFAALEGIEMHLPAHVLRVSPTHSSQEPRGFAVKFDTSSRKPLRYFRRLSLRALSRPSEKLSTFLCPPYRLPFAPR